MSDHFALSDNLVNPEERTMAIEEMLEILRTEDPKLSKLNEKYAVKENINGKTLMEIDRGAADFFGILNTGVHLNGITNDHENKKMWVATRSHQRKTFPGELDNMVAGGQPSNITRQENVVKECYEETYSIVSQNRKAMDKIVDLLIEKETLDGEEFISILSKYTSIPKKERTPQLLN